MSRSSTDAAALARLATRELLRRQKVPASLKDAPVPSAQHILKGFHVARSYLAFDVLVVFVLQRSETRRPLVAKAA